MAVKSAPGETFPSPGVQTRELIILTEPANGGAECPIPEPDELARECDLGPCVVDCELYPLDSP